MLFPGYVFANCDDPYTAAKVRNVAGVLPVINQRRLARELAAVELALNAEVTTAPFTDLVVGREVRVVSGPLQGTRGVLVIRNDKRQAFVLQVTMLGAARELSIDPALLGPA